jgi:hypothetical protein
VEGAQRDHARGGIAEDGFPVGNVPPGTPELG